MMRPEGYLPIFLVQFLFIGGYQKILRSYDSGICLIDNIAFCKRIFSTYVKVHVHVLVTVSESKLAR